MPIFKKTGIEQYRKNSQGVDVLVASIIRRVVILPRSTQSHYYPDGYQDNADWILYGETGDDIRPKDIIKIDYQNLYEGCEFNKDSTNIVMCEVKEPAKKYGTLRYKGRNQEIFLKSFN